MDATTFQFETLLSYLACCNCDVQILGTLFTCHVWQPASKILLEKTSHETGDVAVVLGVVGVLVALVLGMP